MAYPILFEKPNLAQLKKDGYFCVDMHTHSDCSDGITPPNMIIKHLKKNNFKTALTDHNTAQGVLSIYKEKDAKNHVISGIEVNSADGPHILAYFYDSKELSEYSQRYVNAWKNHNPNVKINKGALQIVEELKKNNCIIKLSAPF